MCGIAGIYTNQQKITLQEVKQMTDSISHRGPDGGGHWLNHAETVALGHRRLSIIDLSEDGKQPMHYAEGRYTITFNGEIYNYIELKEKLIRQGYKFHSKSDTEVLLALYDAKKENCLADLDGMFAFAIWDSKENKLFCARDRFGEKPFFYHYIPNKLFVFASEMKALWAYGVEKTMDYSMLYNFLEHDQFTNPEKQSQTFYHHIQKLEHSHYIVIDAGLNLNKQRYWDIPRNQQNISLSEASEKFRHLLTESVRLRLRADVPVGSSLSGGLDSSTIVCIIDSLNQKNHIQQKTFSARFPDYVRDEGKFMQYVLDKTKAEAHFTFPNAAEMTNNFDKLCYHQEEPFSDASIFAQWEVMKLAKQQNVTVLLDGQGADEILAGYFYYYNIFWQELKKTNLNLYDTEWKMYENRFFNIGHPITNTAKLWHHSKQVVKKAIFYDSWRSNIAQTQPKAANYKEEVKQNFLHKDFAAHYQNQYLASVNDAATLNDALYFSTMQQGLSDLLRYADRNSMAHSREIRLPFLSHHIVEFLFSLPPTYKIHNGWTKYIMRNSFQNLLPSEIAWRTDKVGYEPPQKSWLDSKVMTDKMHNAKELLVKNKIILENSKEYPQKQWNFLVASMYL